jgi:hypothetical protein
MITDGLRAFVEAVDRDVSRLPAAGNGAQAPRVEALQASWAQLVGFLALGPAPELRDCPACGRPGMAAATVCGHCWTKLTPVQKKGQVE